MRMADHAHAHGGSIGRYLELFKDRFRVEVERAVYLLPDADDEFVQSGRLEDKLLRCYLEMVSYFKKDGRAYAHHVFLCTKKQPTRSPTEGPASTCTPT